MGRTDKRGNGKDKRGWCGKVNRGDGASGKGEEARRDGARKEGGDQTGQGNPAESYYYDY